MTDDDLIHQLRNSKGWPTLGNAAADRIEELISERDRLAGLLSARDAYDRGELSQPPHSGRNPATLAKMENTDG